MAANAVGDARSLGRRWASYTSVTVVTAANLAGALLVSAILARTWSVDEFLLFGTLNRYLNLLQCVCSLSLGFGIVKQCHGVLPDVQKRVLVTGVCLVGGCSLVAAGVMQLFSHDICSFLGSAAFFGRDALGYVSVWLLAMTCFHVLFSYFSATNQILAANTLNAWGKCLALLSISLWAWYSSAISVPQYYGLVGLLVLIGCLVMFRGQKIGFAVRANGKLGRKMAAYSASRCLDNLLRLATTAVVVTFLLALRMPLVAGQIALLSMLLRGFESLFQPLVMLSLADACAARERGVQTGRLQELWDGLLLISLLVMAGLAFFGRPLLEVWLGGEYRHLGVAFGILSFSLLPSVATILLRAHLDCRWHFSPIVLVQGCGLALVALGTGALYLYDTLDVIHVTALITVASYVKLLMIYWMLRNEYAIRCFAGRGATRFYRKVGRRLF